MMIRTKNEVFEEVRVGPWVGYVPVQIKEVAAPRARWSWGRIPLGLVRQMTAFFEWSLKETGGETVCHLYYHEGRHEWAALVLPQKGYTAASVELLPDHPGRAEAVERLGPGWEPAGTCHHHGKMSAFQSCTDAKDEIDVFGLHVTIGDIGSSRYSLHARCSFKKHFTEAHLSDWIDLPESLDEFPLKIQDDAALHLATTPAPETPFPERWKANVIKAPVIKAPVYHWQSGTGAVYTPPYSDGLDDYHRQRPWLRLEEDLKGAVAITELSAKELADLARAYDEDAVLDVLVDLAREHHLTFLEMAREFEDLDKPIAAKEDKLMSD